LFLQENGMSENEPWQDPRLPEDARLTSLDKRLKQAQLQEAVRTGKTKSNSQVGRSQGMRILSDLFGIPFGSAIIGWLLDRWLGTAPWLMLAMLFLGFGIAVRNVLWISRQRPK
jgi:ATP synthase protein I